VMSYNHIIHQQQCDEEQRPQRVPRVTCYISQSWMTPGEQAMLPAVLELDACCLGRSKHVMHAAFTCKVRCC
jgi:hypothetical protein